MLDKRLQDALDLVGVPTIERCLVETQEGSERLQFAGFPSILLDGSDPFRSTSFGFGLTCRVYSTPDGPSGAPSLAQIVEAVREAVAAGEA